MKSWRKSAICLGLSAWLLLGNGPASAEKPEEIKEHYLAEAGGDTVLAMDNLATDIMLFIRDQEYLEHDLRVEKARADKLATWYDAEERSWFERFWDDTKMYISFVIGALLGLNAAR